jgi:hypothetical protein
MARKKKLNFKLDPEWLLKEPLDFEYNKYTLLDYIQKCEKRFDNLEIYPDFVELSLHLANLQSLIKENTLLLTNKKFESCDDEILLKELYPKKPRNLSIQEQEELDKTIKFSGSKLFDAFNQAKAIWNLVYDNVHVSIKKNKSNIGFGRGYIFYYRKEDDIIMVWEYEIKKVKGDEINNKTYITLIYESSPNDINLPTILDNFSNWNNEPYYQELPVFEMKSNQPFPMDATLIPIMKRKIMAYIFQIVNIEKIKNFDSEI